MTKKTIVVIGGPTAVGKTALSVKVAKTLGSEVLSADSRQCYRELRIGTARPGPEEMDGVPHHFIASHSVETRISAGDYSRFARKTMEEVFSRNDWLIMTGGTGLYIRAALEGMDDLPEAPEELRRELNGWSLAQLQQELKTRDPEYAEQVDMQNPQRLVRALEVTLSTGRPFSSFLDQEKESLPYRIIRIALNTDRDELYRKINRRVDAMVEEGLFEEALSLREYKDHYALRTVGYKEVFAFAEGELTKAEAIESIRQNTRRYAKRQLTWFRKDKRYLWFSPSDGPEIVRFLQENSH